MILSGEIALYESVRKRQELRERKHPPVKEKNGFHLYFSDCRDRRRLVRQVNECAEQHVCSEQLRLKHVLLLAWCSIELSSH